MGSIGSPETLLNTPEDGRIRFNRGRNLRQSNKNRVFVIKSSFLLGPSHFNIHLKQRCHLEDVGSMFGRSIEMLGDYTNKRQSFVTQHGQNLTNTVALSLTLRSDKDCTW